MVHIHKGPGSIPGPATKQYGLSKCTECDEPFITPAKHSHNLTDPDIHVFCRRCWMISTTGEWDEYCECDTCMIAEELEEWENEVEESDIYVTYDDSAQQLVVNTWKKALEKEIYAEKPFYKLLTRKKGP